MMNKSLGLGVSRAERVAVCTLRRAVNGEVGWGQAAVCPFGIGRDLASVRVRFLEVWEGSAALCRQALQLRPPGGLGVTKNERRVLKALAAAQEEDGWLLDNYLYKLALEPARRQRLAGAVEALGAALAVHGYWLPLPGPACPMIPASALKIAFAHGRDLEMLQIAWP